MTSKKKAIGPFQAVIEGVACGDALGWPCEFKSVAQIRARFGPEGVTDLSQTERKFTDDTQMTVALAEGLLDAITAARQEAAAPAYPSVPEVRRHILAAMAEPQRVMPYVAKRFAEWSVAPRNGHRAPGNTCMAACDQLVRGVPWNLAGVRDSKGCGAAMRVAPIGLLYSDLHALGAIARASAEVTHRHPVAAQAAHVAALAVRLLVDGFNPEHLVRTLIFTVEQDGGIDPDFADLLERVEGAVRATQDGTYRPEEIQVAPKTHRFALGAAWTADEAVACALYCFMLAHAREQGYVETVRYGANTDGDSDSIAAIAGSFAGAHWGLHEDRRGVPVEWACTIEDAQELARLAIRLEAASLTMSLAPEPAREGVDGRAS